METLTHNGRTVAYRQTEADGAPILYVHGAGGNHQLWQHQYGPDSHVSAVAVDLTGHGGSDNIDTHHGKATLDVYAGDLVAVVRKTGAGAVVGNSMGGAVALWAVLEHNLDPGALVLCGTGAKLGVSGDLLDLLESDFDAAVEALSAPGLLFHDAPAEVVEQAVAVMRETGQAVTARDFHTCGQFDVRGRLDEVETPALALTGEHDGMTPPSFTEYLGECLPDCETAILDDCAHLSMLERPEIWNECVGQFLTGVQ